MSFLLVNFFPLIFTKNQKNSTIEALWGTVISQLPKKYSAKNTIPLDTLNKITCGDGSRPFFNCANGVEFAEYHKYCKNDNGLPTCPGGGVPKAKRIFRNEHNVSIEFVSMKTKSFNCQIEVYF